MRPKCRMQDMGCWCLRERSRRETSLLFIQVKIQHHYRHSAYYMSKHRCSVLCSHYANVQYIKARGTAHVYYVGYYFPPPPVWSVATPNGDQPLKPFNINKELPDSLQQQGICWIFHFWALLCALCVGLIVLASECTNCGKCHNNVCWLLRVFCLFTL